MISYAGAPAAGPIPTARGAGISVEHLTWRPLRRRTPVLADLNLQVPAGQRLLLVGPSGAGKSTLLRAVCGLLQTADSGELHGQVHIDGRPPGAAGSPPAGLLLQDPTACTVAETVGRDVAFGPENQQVPRPQIWKRVRAVLSATGFPYGLDHPTGALSGGEAQRLALAGSLALGAPVLLLDEPTSMLDPDAATQVRDAVQAAVAHRGQTVIVVEHHFGPWLDFADRLVVLDATGQITADGPPHQVLAEQATTLAAHGVWVPGAAAPPVTVVDRELVEPWQPATGSLIRAQDLTVRLDRRLTGTHRSSTTALHRVGADITAGRGLAITGPSGAGKSTLLSVLAGLQRPTAGTVTAAATLATRRGRQPWRWRSPDLAARLAWVPQLPEHGMVARTVRDEVLASGRACGRSGRKLDQRADGLLAALGLESLEGASPYHLSGGQQRRLLLAAALAHGPCAVTLDEPTIGQDRITWAAVIGAVASARSGGAGVALASHDEAAIAVLGDDTLTLRHGSVAP